MADYDLRCVSCGHGPHNSGACMGGVSCACPQFIRADIHAAQALTNINNLLFGAMQRMEIAIANIHDVFLEAHPEARDAVNARREELRKENERVNTEAAAESDGSSGAGSHPVSFPRATDPAED